MCGKCEGKMSKASTGIGILALLLAIVSRLAHFYVMTLGPRSFAAASALFLLLAIALNTCPDAGHSHEESH